MRSFRRLVAYAAAAIAVVGAPAASARAQADSCPRAVVFTLPGVTWEDVREFRPPQLLDLVRDGAAGSVSVRTIASRTSYSSGYATLGGGARLQGIPVSGGLADGGVPAGALSRDARAAGIDELVRLADEAGYQARPGALGSALGDIPLIAVGNADLGRPPPSPGGAGRWTVLAAMSREGSVDYSATGPELLQHDPAWPYGVRTDSRAIDAAVEAAFDRECASIVIDQGDLTRADQYADLTFDELAAARRRALFAADRLLGFVRERVDPARDLLLVVSPTSPAWAPVAHLGVAVAAGPEFPAGATVLSSSTRRRGVVTLPDVAPTVLSHLGIAQPASMNGRPWVATSAGGVNRVEYAVDLDEESVFVDRIKSPVSAWFVISQVIVYLMALALLAWRESKSGPSPVRHPRVEGRGLARGLELAALALVAFPISTFFAGAIKAHELGAPMFVLLLLTLDAALVAIVSVAATRPLDRLLIVTSFTLATIAADLMTGGRLQLNTVFGYSPIVAGRFAGAGNIAFAILGASTVLTGALVVNRWRGRAALWVVAGLFAFVVVVDGAPPFGSDVGGVLALVPALAVTWVLLSGRRPSMRVVALGAAGALAALAVFIAFDLSGPPESRTHLGRLIEDIRARGFDVLTDTITRKAASNLRVFSSTIWTLFVPPGLAALAWLLARPRGRWERLAETFPKLRAGLVGGLLVAVLGFAVNDSGIVVPAVVLSFLVPMALLVHLVLEMDRGERERPQSGIRTAEPVT
jgi:hypothetical protein